MIKSSQKGQWKWEIAPNFSTSPFLAFFKFSIIMPAISMWNLTWIFDLFSDYLATHSIWNQLNWAQAKVFSSLSSSEFWGNALLIWNAATASFYASLFHLENLRLNEELLFYGCSQNTQISKPQRIANSHLVIIILIQEPMLEMSKVCAFWNHPSSEQACFVTPWEKHSAFLTKLQRGVVWWR